MFRFFHFYFTFFRLFYVCLLLILSDLFDFFFRFQATGDHLPVAPPAPAHSQLAAVQAAQYNANNAYELNGNTGADGFDDGQYDPRYNDPGFEGNFRAGAVQSSYVHTPQPAQPQYVPQQQPQQQQQAYHNNLNNINYQSDYQYQSTTPHPHRFQPPGKRFRSIMTGKSVSC